MFTKTGKSGLGVVLFGLSVAAGALGCSSTTHVAAAPVSPAVAFGANTSDVDQGCSLDGMPQIVATHIAPKAGISAIANGGRVWLRFATAHDPRVTVAIDPATLAVVDDAMAPVEVAAAKRGPVEVDLPDHRHLVAWTTGSLDQGLHVEAVTLDDQGVALGAPIDLGFNGSAIGRPAVAFSEGKGVLAFVESNDAGFQLVVVRAACGAP